MRGKIFAIVIMLFVLLIGAQVCADAVTKYFYDDDWHEYHGNEFALSVNGSVLKPEVPPIVFNDRSVVPARDVFEALGADVDWDAKTQSVKVKLENIIIKLKINSTVAYINSKSANMEIAPKIINGKTMIPVRFVGEKLGFDVSFDSKTDTISVNSNINQPETPGNEQAGTSGVVTLVKHTISSDSKQLFVNIITAHDNPDFSDFVLKEPNRIVVDITNSSFEKLPAEISVSAGNISKIRFGQNGTNARVVVDLSENLGYTVSSSGKAVNLSVQLDTSIQTEKPQDPFSCFAFESQGSRDVIEVTKTVQKVEQNSGANSLDITVSGSNLSLKPEELPVKSLFASKVCYEPLSATEAKYRVMLGKNEITFSRSENQIIIKSQYKPVKRSVMLDPGHGGTDPGAVYKDENGNVIAQEKDINLAVSLKVRDILKANNVEVHMIRTTDVYVDFQKVGGIANDIGATLFVSLHANSAAGVPDANGVEVYSYLEGGTVTNSMTGKQLAQNILDSTLKTTGAKDRGVRNGQNLAVIKHTAAPAVLVEVGFITNETERNLMMQEEYQQKLAEGVAQGILNSFNEMGV